MVVGGVDSSWNLSTVYVPPANNQPDPGGRFDPPLSAGLTMILSDLLRTARALLVPRDVIPPGASATGSGWGDPERLEGLQITVHQGLQDKGGRIWLPRGWVSGMEHG